MGEALSKGHKEQNKLQEAAFYQNLGKYNPKDQVEEQEKPPYLKVIPDEELASYTQEDKALMKWQYDNLDNLGKSWAENGQIDLREGLKNFKTFVNATTAIRNIEKEGAIK